MYIYIYVSYAFLCCNGVCVCVQKVGKDPKLPVRTLDTSGLFSRAGSERIRHRQFELALCTPWMNGYGKSTYEMMDGQIDGRTHAHIHCFIVCIYIYILNVYIYIQRYICIKCIYYIYITCVLKIYILHI